MASSVLASPLTVQKIKETLTQEDKDEMDKPDFLQPLKLYLDGVNNLSLTKEQQEPFSYRVRMYAAQRTDVHKALQNDPEVAKTEINPVVIIGLPRSGTTLLQRLLASDPKFVSPMFWELLNPCPPGRPENWEDSEKYRVALERHNQLIPSSVDVIQSKHELKLDKPEECMWILFAHFYDIGTAVFPAMQEWRRYGLNPPEENLRKAYEYYKDVLQCIFYEGLEDGKRPLLKAPLHCLYLDMYRKIFPNVKFIFPYRNAKEMIGSGCSIFGMGPAMMDIDCSKEQIKNYTLDFYRLASSRVVKTLKSMPKDSYFTISYSELVKDPMAAVQDLYSHFGWKITAETAEHLQSYMEENRQHKLGAHKYSLEDFGVTEEDLKENLADFLDYFGEKENLL